MKKIFTLISAALVAATVGAQEAETFSAVVTDGDGNPAIEEHFAAINVGGVEDKVEIQATTSVKLEARAGQAIKEIDSEGNVLEWGAPEWQLKNRGDINFWWIQGGGVPFVGYGVEEIITDGEPTGNYRATYTYYTPDGLSGLPVNGEYVTLTPDKDGKFKVGFWANKGNSRELWIVKGSDKLPLVAGTDFHVEGYCNGITEDGVMKYLDDIPVVEVVNAETGEVVNRNIIGSAEYDKGDIDDDGNPKYFNMQNQPKFGYLFFDGKANETYYIFGQNWQFGFQGFEFTPEAGQATGITEVKTDSFNATAPIFNLAGQKVSNSYKGVVIQSGKKFIQK